MNILFITQVFPYNIADNLTSTALREFIEYWGEQGHNIKVIRPWFRYEKEKFPVQPRSKINNAVDVEFIRPIRIPLLKIPVYNRKRFLKSITEKPDVVICHLYNSYFGFHWVAKYFKIPLIIGIHMSDVRIAKHIYHRIHQWSIFKKADAFAIRSYAIKRLFDISFPGLDNKSFLTLSGLPNLFLENSKKVRIKKVPGRVQIVSVCKLIPLEHIDRVLKALSAITEGIDWFYTIVGDGEERNHLESLVAELDLTERVAFTGNVSRDSVPEILNKQHIFVMPSYPETLGLAYMEAMACGNLVIGSKGWGIDGIIQDGVNGFFCDSTFIPSIKEKLELAINQVKSDDQKMRFRGLKTVQGLSISDQATAYFNEIQKVVKSQK